jgi:putative FmdB family regulatory protein
MPIYEYRCNKCSKTIEVIQKFSDKPLRKHEKCGGVLSKLISASSFHLKGTGWYKTDYAPKAESPAAKEESSNGKKDKDAKTETTAEKSTASTESLPVATATPGKKEKHPKSSASKN